MNRHRPWVVVAVLVAVLVMLPRLRNAAAGGPLTLGAAPTPAAGPTPAPAGTVLEYPSMTALRKVEQAGVAYELSWTITDSPLIVVAPHGGGIELGTSEIASAVAGVEHTQCHFKGKLPPGQNFPRLHVTSTRWDVEECMILVGQRTHALSIHGAAGADREVYLGGRDDATGHRLRAALSGAGFTVAATAPDDLAGRSPDNFVNKDADRAGVQLELTKGLRDLLVRDGELTQRGQDFAAVVRSVYQPPR